MTILMESPAKNVGGNIMLRKIVRFIIALIMIIPVSIIIVPLFMFLDWLLDEDDSVIGIFNWLVSWLTFKDF